MPNPEQYDFKPAYKRLEAIMDHDNFKATEPQGLSQYTYMSAWAAAMSDLNEEQYLD